MAPGETNLSQERQATKGTEMLPRRMITPFNINSEKCLFRGVLSPILNIAIRRLQLDILQSKERTIMARNNFV